MLNVLTSAPRRAVRRLLGSQAAAMVLLYHRVAKLDSDPQLLCVTPENFEDQLKHLRDSFVPLTLRDMAARARSGTLTKNSIVLTFDDGYADNLLAAKPLLEKYNIPATVFVASRFVDTQSEFYWDELDRLLLDNHPLPTTLSIEIAGSTFHWNLGDEASRPTTTESSQKYWSVASPQPFTIRQQIYATLCDQLRPLSHNLRENIVASLRQWAGQTGLVRPSHRGLSASKLKELARGGLIEIGAHTVDHLWLSAHNAAEQQRQILTSKRDLETILGQPVTSFSYPYGARSAYNDDSLALVKQAGFTAACSNFSGTIRRDPDLFQLPRMLVRDWTGDRLVTQIRKVMP
jgi:peptidoglycan/xylan/chitin deacetylase (PgdA/CDA1 family)